MVFINNLNDGCHILRCELNTDIKMIPLIRHLGVESFVVLITMIYTEIKYVIIELFRFIKMLLYFANHVFFVLYKVDVL